MIIPWQRITSAIFLFQPARHYLFAAGYAMIIMGEYEYMTGRYAYEYGRYDSQEEGRKGPFC